MIMVCIEDITTGTIQVSYLEAELTVLGHICGTEGTNNCVNYIATREDDL